MRPGTFVFLAAVCLIVYSIRGYSSGNKGHAKFSKNAVTVVPRADSSPETFLSFKLDKPTKWVKDDDPRPDIAPEIQRELEKRLRERIPDLLWSPSEKFVIDHTSVEWDTSADSVIVDGKELQSVSLGLQISNGDYRQILEEDQHLRRDFRQGFLFRIVAGITALFAAIAGYVRLDEATKGYYTVWLRLASLAFVGVISTGLFLFA